MHETAIFPYEWKNGNILHIPNKRDNQTPKNYRLASLLPLLVEKVFKDYCLTKFLHCSSNQSDFKPDDSCIYQLLSITHEIYKSFDAGLEVRCFYIKNI